MACVVGMAKRVYSDFPVLRISGFLGCKKQRHITCLGTWNWSWGSLILVRYKPQYKSLLTPALNFTYRPLGLLIQVFCNFTLQQKRSVNAQGKVESSSLLYGHRSRPVISGLKGKTLLSLMERPEHLCGDIHFTETFFHTRIIFLHVFPLLCKLLFKIVLEVSIFQT